MEKNLFTPVLLLAFNRPEKTRLVFESIRTVKPKKLYVAIDGPRDGRTDDIIKSKQIKDIVKNVDWECETHYLFHEKNLGCSLSGYTAWKWVFEHESRFIFIEDDGLGNPSAFYFIQDMLEKYADDDRIAYVGGVNYGPKFGNASYFFSRLPSATYFMGTWKRVFEKYEYNLESYPNIFTKKTFRKNFLSVCEYICVCNNLDLYYKSTLNGKRMNTYDQQMIYLSYKYNMYSIYPNINMVSNIGLDDGANNHTDKNDPFYKEYGNRIRFELNEIKYIDTFNINKKFEVSFFKKRYLYNKNTFKATIIAILSITKRHLKYLFK